MKHLSLIALLLCILLPPTHAAQAAGGAHIVDDSEPETPGLCHVENWVTLFLQGDGYINVAPACTSEKIPWLEMGAAFTKYWGPAFNAPVFGPQFKVNFLSADKGAPVGVGLGLNSGVDLTTGALANASTIGLVTIPFGGKHRLNLNAGWWYLVTAETQNAAFYGAQLEIDLGHNVMLMVEGFGRAPGNPGFQTGLRYTPNKGNIDFDLLVANYFDQATTRFITFGATIRF